MTDHARFRLLAAGASDGLLTTDEARELDAHLEDCGSCRVEVHRFAQDRVALASLAPTPVSARLRRRIEGDDRQTPSVRWPLLATAALVGTLLGSAVLSGAGDRQGDTRPPASDAPFAEPSIPAFAAAHALRFRDPAIVTVEQRPSSLALADLDGDGDVDVLIGTDDVPDTFLLLLGDGQGDFAGHSRVEIDGVGAFDLEDVDDDGFVDILGLATADGTVVVLYGMGRSRFLDPMRLSVGTGPREAQVIDVDGDGRRDIVTANFGSDDLSVLARVGSREYVARQRVNTGDGPGVIAAGDFDADGAVDVAIGTRDEPGLTVHWGTGGGAFGEAQPVLGDFDPIDIVIGDVDSNGSSDLVVANGATGTISILVARGSDRTWTESVLAAPEGHFGRLRDVEIADMDGDDRLDLIATNGDTNEVLIWLGNEGGFADPFSVPVGRGPRLVEVRDLDGSGRLDLVATHQDDGTVQVVLASP